MPRFAQQGIKFAAISYDSKEILKFFGPDVNNSVVPYIPKYPR